MSTQLPNSIDLALVELEEIEQSSSVKNVLDTLEPSAQKLYNLPITVVVAILTGACFLFVGSIFGYLALVYLLVPAQLCKFLVGVFTLIGLCLGTLFAGGRWGIAKEETNRRLQDEKGQTKLERVKLERRIEEEKNQILLNKLEKLTPWISETANLPITQKISKELATNVQESIQKQLMSVNTDANTDADTPMRLKDILKKRQDELNKTKIQKDTDKTIS